MGLLRDEGRGLGVAEKLENEAPEDDPLPLELNEGERIRRRRSRRRDECSVIAHGDADETRTYASHASHGAICPRHSSNDSSNVGA